MGKTAVIEKKSQRAAAAPEAPSCQHHWIIATPQGATSIGRCKVCGEQREFRNSASDYLWEDESASGYNAWRGNRGSRTTRLASDEDEGVNAATIGGQTVMS